MVYSSVFDEVKIRIHVLKLKNVKLGVSKTLLFRCQSEPQWPEINDVEALIWL